MLEKSKYKSLAEWKKDCPSAYTAASKRGIIDDICKKFGWVKKKSWDLKSCIEQSKKFKNRSEWSKKCTGSYQAAHRNKWLDKCTGHMEVTKKHKNFWDLKKCQEDALKYNLRSEWFKNSNSAYISARKNNWIEECTKHMEFYGKQDKFR